MGGLGPETTSKFYLDLIDKSRKFCKSYPRVIIDSISFPFSLEEEIIFKSKNEYKILPALKDSIRRLNQARVDFIVIPCNTLHIFLKELEKDSSVPILDIVQETLKFIKNIGYKKIGLLATGKTVDSKLYEIPLDANNIETILPTKNEQLKISKAIVKILKNNIGRTEKEELNSIIRHLAKRNAEAILLDCTDLQLVLKQNKFKIPLIDSMEIIEKSTFKRLFIEG